MQTPLFLLALLFLSAYGNAGENPDHECSNRRCFSKVKNVSIISLIANPEKFDGELIRISGFIYLEFEGSHAYLDKTHFDESLRENGIALSVDHWSKQQNYCHLSYCVIEGVFDSKVKRHGLGSAGSIRDIYRMDKIVNRRDYENLIKSSRNTPEKP